MYVFDGHIDTLYQLVQATNQDKDLGTIPNTHVSVDKLVEGSIGAQIFAVYVEASYLGMALQRGLAMIDVFWQNIEKYGDKLGVALKSNDFDQLQKANKVACLLSVEGGEVLMGELGNLRNLFRLGVRALGLTWNFRNELASGVGESSGGGLSDFGRQVIYEMNRLGMIVDVSHLNVEGFWQVIEASNQPIIASHSCAYSLCAHRRNLTDEQIKSIADKGGVIGVNYCPSFLTEKGVASIEDVVRHIQYLLNVGGSDVVGLGSDFDGINRPPEGLENVACSKRIADLLYTKGYPSDVVEKVMGKNFIRVAKDVQK